MLFNSYDFIFLFLPITLVGYFLIAHLTSHALAIAWLTAASMFFYAWWSSSFLLLVIFSIALNYVTGVLLQSRRLGIRGSLRTFILATAICANLGLLGYYKYFGFLASNWNVIFDYNLPLDPIVLPLAISFFTFTQITYIVDVFKGQRPEYPFITYCLFVTFFPHLIAGPIVHHHEIMPQFSRRSASFPSRMNIAVGLTIFFLGLFKKTVLADGIAQYATPVFNAAEAGERLSFFECWGGALAYTFQLYFDFSGYSDMAIGGARLFGIKLPINFDSPYRATSIIDFWRRWHMTLSRFLKDYVYIPLGGNRRGRWRRYANVLATMAIGGLWHGAGWTFVFWGLLHGLYLMINYAWREFVTRKGGNSGRPNWWWRRLGQTATFLAVVIGWVFFRAASFDAALTMLEGMIGLHGVSVPTAIAGALGPIRPLLEKAGVVFSLGGGTMFVATYGWIIALSLIAFLAPNSQELLRTFSPAIAYVGLDRSRESGGLPTPTLRWKPSAFWAVATAAIAACGILSLSQVTEFLYFQF